MERGKLIVATCQHDVSSAVSENLKSILKQIRLAKSNQADIVHFSECNLTGYGGIELQEIRTSNYGIIREGIHKIGEVARSLRINVIVGSHFYVDEDEKPRNSLLFINETGKIQARYDKRILTGTVGTMDHRHYSHGKNPGLFMVKGVKCGLLICHEWRYPELFREYKKMGAQVVFHSWYDGGFSDEEFKQKGKAEGELIVGSVRGYAANNYLWISGSNTSNKQSCFPSFTIRPDGLFHKKLKRNTPGVLISSIDLGEKYEDPSFYGRNRIMK